MTKRLAMDAAVLGTLRAICGEDNPGPRRPRPEGQGDEVFNDCAVLIEAGTALHVGPRPPAAVR